MGDRRYYRVGPAIWAEDWDDDTTLVALYILTCGHRTTEGLFRFPLEYAIGDLKGWTLERFRKAFGELLSDGFIEYDEDARVCLITKALEWQAPENPNQVTAALKKVADLPPTTLFARFLASADAHCERLAEGLRQRFPERLAEGSAQAFGKPQARTQAPSQAQGETPPAPAGAAPDPSLPAVSYNRVKVPSETVATAVHLLEVFNRLTQRQIGATAAGGKASPALRQIVGAMRTRPDVTAAAWEEAISRTIASPPDWIDGPVQIGHVFGEKAAEWALTDRSTPADAGSARLAGKYGGRVQ